MTSRPVRSSKASRPLDLRAARLIAADLLARRPWSAHDFAARLRRRGAPAELVAALVAELVSRGYLDDAAFARQWVETRAARGYGPARLAAELRARGIDGGTVEVALARLAPEAAMEQALAAAKQRLPALADLDPARAAARLRDYLLRRGYTPQSVTRIVRRLIEPEG